MHNWRLLVLLITSLLQPILSEYNAFDGSHSSHIFLGEDRSLHGKYQHGPISRNLHLNTRKLLRDELRGERRFERHIVTPNDYSQNDKVRLSIQDVSKRAQRESVLKQSHARNKDTSLYVGSIYGNREILKLKRSKSTFNTPEETSRTYIEDFRIKDNSKTGRATNGHLENSRFAVSQRNENSGDSNGRYIQKCDLTRDMDEMIDRTRITRERRDLLNNRHERGIQQPLRMRVSQQNITPTRYETITKKDSKDTGRTVTVERDVRQQDAQSYTIARVSEAENYAIRQNSKKVSVDSREEGLRKVRDNRHETNNEERYREGRTDRMIERNPRVRNNPNQSRVQNIMHNVRNERPDFSDHKTNAKIIHESGIIIKRGGVKQVVNGRITRNSEERNKNFRLVKFDIGIVVQDNIGVNANLNERVRKDFGINTKNIERYLDTDTVRATSLDRQIGRPLAMKASNRQDLKRNLNAITARLVLDERIAQSKVERSTRMSWTGYERSTSLNHNNRQQNGLRGEDKYKNRDRHLQEKRQQTAHVDIRNIVRSSLEYNIPEQNSQRIINVFRSRKVVSVEKEERKLNYRRINEIFERSRNRRKNERDLLTMSNNAKHLMDKSLERSLDGEVKEDDMRRIIIARRFNREERYTNRCDKCTVSSREDRHSSNIRRYVISESRDLREQDDNTFTTSQFTLRSKELYRNAREDRTSNRNDERDSRQIRARDASFTSTLHRFDNRRIKEIDVTSNREDRDTLLRGKSNLGRSSDNYTKRVISIERVTRQPVSIKNIGKHDARTYEVRNSEISERFETKNIERNSRDNDHERTVSVERKLPTFSSRVTDERNNRMRRERNAIRAIRRHNNNVERQSRMSTRERNLTLQDVRYLTLQRNSLLNEHSSIRTAERYDHSRDRVVEQERNSEIPNRMANRQITRTNNVRARNAIQMRDRIDGFIRSMTTAVRTNDKRLARHEDSQNRRIEENLGIRNSLRNIQQYTLDLNSRNNANMKHERSRRFTVFGVRTMAATESDIKSALFHWQYLFYVIQGIYILDVVMQLCRQKEKYIKFSPSSWLSTSGHIKVE